MDEIYSKLIERIPEELTASGVAAGRVWVIIRSECGCGSAAVYDAGHQTGRLPAYEGKKLKELAMLIDSEDSLEKGISMAAINTYYNQYDRLRELEAKGVLTIDETGNSFVEYGDLVEGKDVSFVGHFCGLEGYMSKAGSVTVLEKRPLPGDLPAEMCDEVIPGKDYVFMTGATLANCTADHILSLCREKDNTQAIFVGPTTTMSEVLFEYGAAELSGSVITEPDKAFEAALSDEHMAIFRVGQKLRVVKKSD